MGYLIIDTDGASDDLIALRLAADLAGPLPIALVTTVAGAVEVDRATANVDAVLTLAGIDVTLAAGADRPLVRPLENGAAIEAHGADGVAGVRLPPGSCPRSEQPAAKAIIDAARSRPGEVTIVCIGPLTNLALALRLAPDVAQFLDRVVVSSGTVSAPGNVVPAADFNAWIDPEAFAVVLDSGARITLVPWDRYVESAVLTEAELDMIRSGPADMGRLLLAANEGIADVTGRITPQRSGLVIGDSLAVAVAQRPELVSEAGRFHVAVETASPLTRGATVVDVYGVTDNEPNVEVVLGIDREAFVRLLIRALTSVPTQPD